MPAAAQSTTQAVTSPGRWLCLVVVLVGALTAAGCDGQDPAVKRGRDTFTRACAACHGTDAQGLEGLGANLRTSEFVGQSTDAQLIEMIKAGKDATDTHPAMPPKGGVVTLTDERLADVVAYIRSLRDG
ncbi:MAG: cytochrome c [Phycisphaerales bacterium]